MLLIIRNLEQGSHFIMHETLVLENFLFIVQLTVPTVTGNQNLTEFLSLLSLHRPASITFIMRHLLGGANRHTITATNHIVHRFVSKKVCCSYVHI